MALPSSGALALGDVNVELGNARTIQIALGAAAARGLYGVASGAIRLAADGYGKSSFTPYQRKATYTTNTSWTVPSPVTSVRVKMWGAGGGNKKSAGPSSGGGGGFARADIAVTVGNTLLIAVGGAGLSSGNGGANGGGNAGSYGGGSAGGYSGVFLNNSATQANARIIAGGGGGGGAVSGPYYSYGGAGGGSSGLTSESNASHSGGIGGSQSAGGSLSGSALQGGNATASFQVPGGGGYFGGGAATGLAGGGGGSGYVNGTNTTLTAGYRGTVANSGDSDYVTGKGNGAVNVTGNGQAGYVVVYY